MIKQFKDNPFLKNTATLISGTTLAQAIPFITSFFIARLYSPEDFGVLALFVSWMGILTVVSTLRYEKAIILPKEEEEGIAVTRLSQKIVFGFTILLSVIALLLAIFPIEAIQSYGLYKYKWLLVTGILLLASDQIYYHWANRLGKYKKMGLSKIANNLSAGSLQLLFGGLGTGAIGLIIAKLIGIAGSLGVNYSTFKPFSKQRTPSNKIKEVAKIYEKFPKYLTFAHALNSFGLLGLPIVLAFYFNETEIGLFAMTQRVIMLPISIVSRAVGDVFRERATKDLNNTGTCRPIYTKTLLGLSAVAIIPFAILLLFAPWLFQVFFGPEWIVSGEYAQIFAFLFLFQFIASPLTNMFMIAQKQGIELFWQIAFFVASIGSIVIGSYFFDTLYEILIVFTVARAFVYLLAIMLTYPMTNKT